MLSKLSVLALCAAPLVSALTLHIPENPTSSGEVTITWDTAPGDPEYFTLELNHPSFNDALAIKTTIDPNQGSVTITLPVVEAQPGYTIEAVNIGNIDDVYSVTGPFAIGENTSSFTALPSSRSVTGSASSTGVGSITRPTGSAPGTASTSAPSSGSSGPASSSGPSPPAISDLTDNGAAASSIAPRLGVLCAAVAGVFFVL